ncbi:MAG: 6-carboxytetrahydropterin synthase QueD [Bacteroidales bacterium]|nr:6-carboxytetrahydropterin synthase QueD [Bacteroidales bacterium]
MSYIRITKEFKFDTAHALKDYDGRCRNLHGHSYKLFVTVRGKPESGKSSPKQGMVMDFGDLKEIVKEEIVDKLDHAVVLNREADTRHLGSIDQLFDKTVLVDYQPTTENMLTDFAARIKKRLPADVTLVKLMLRETITSYAEWFAEDNE